MRFQKAITATAFAGLNNIFQFGTSVNKIFCKVSLIPHSLLLLRAVNVLVAI